jgi:superoxide dismutase, Cu-Zn family
MPRALPLFKAGTSLVALALAALLTMPATADQHEPDTDEAEGFESDVEELEAEEEDEGQADDPAAAGPGEEPEVLTTTFIDLDGQEVGAAAIREVPTGGVLIDINIDGLPPERWLGFHIHEEGVCDPEDGFESAGGHFNPTDVEHGYLVEGGFHAGDMPNQFVPDSGILRAEVYNHMVELDVDNGIRGLSLMIHDEADDYESQPAGDAGGRIACAVIE